MVLGQCTICRDEFESVSTISILLCGHTFHNDCILRWLNSASQCPVCRKPASKDRLVSQIYFDSPDATESQIDWEASKRNGREMRTRLNALDSKVDRIEKIILRQKNEERRKRLKLECRVRYLQFLNSTLLEENQTLKGGDRLCGKIVAEEEQYASSIAGTSSVSERQPEPNSTAMEAESGPGMNNDPSGHCDCKHCSRDKKKSQ